MPRYKSPNGTGRVGRDKKKKALKSDKYKQDIEILSKRGLTPDDIERIYNRCQERSQTKLAKHTVASKLVELLEYFDERNDKIEESSKGFISKDDTIEMVIKNPRILSSSISNNIISKCEIITEKKKSIVDANRLIKSNPGIFRKTKKVIREGR